MIGLQSTGDSRTRQEVQRQLEARGENSDDENDRILLSGLSSSSSVRRWLHFVSEGSSHSAVGQCLSDDRHSRLPSLREYADGG